MGTGMDRNRGGIRRLPHILSTVAVVGKPDYARRAGRAFRRIGQKKGWKSSAWRADKGLVREVPLAA
jgi:hypothetical protein